jgi:hypothetical protein
MADEQTRFREICRPRNVPEAHVVRLRLEEAGIPVMVQNEILQGVVGELPFGWPTAPRLLVAEEDVSTARELLKMFEAERPEARTELPAENVCLACGAEMAATVECPQCGWTFTAPSVR